jgi:hypothetical protein
MAFETFLGALASILTVINYVPYIKKIVSRKVQPHAFSWLTWSALAGINFVIQISQLGGPGSWIWAVSCIETLLIFFLSLKFGKKNIKTVDWICLTCAGIAFIFWKLTNNPVFSILLLSGISLFGGFIPTFRKSYHSPHRESLSLYITSVAILIISIFALENFKPVNFLYPSLSIRYNFSLVTYLLRRRKKTGLGRIITIEHVQKALSYIFDN